MKKYLSLVIVAVAFTVSCKSTQPASATAQKTQTVKPAEAPQTTPVTPLPTATETATSTTNNESLKRYGKANTVNLTPEQRKQVAAMSEEQYKTFGNSDNKKAD